MKRTALCLALLALLVLLVGCKKKNEVTLYCKKVVPSIVSSASVPQAVSDGIAGIRTKLEKTLGTTVPSGTDETEKTGIELVFGDTSRAITARAKAILPAQSGDDAAFAIIFDRDGAAVVWNHDAAGERGVKYFSDNYLTGATLQVTAGTTYVGRISLSAYQEEKDMERRQEIDKQFEKRFNVISDPVIRSAVKGFYEEFYDPDKLIRWWAGLYDPDLGGFYYSNSARDSEGFLPDMESTYQIIWRLQEMVPDLPAFLGPEITAKIVSFYQTKQDPSDGYFYHPQWTKAESRANVMRYSRDQDWAVFVLGWLDAEPLYPTALDRAKNATSSIGTEWQPNVNSVRNYANDLMNTTSCEHWANQFETQATTFEAAGMLDTVLDVLDERINPEYGLWDKGYNAATDKYTNLAGNEETPYGLYTCAYKIAKMYNIGGRPIPYALKMAANGIKAICSRDPGVRVTYLFNPWATLGNVCTNLKNLGTPAEVAEYDTLIKTTIIEMIDALSASLGRYMWEDGSFSYLQSGSKDTIYSTPVCLGVQEGDVNGNNLVVLLAEHISNAIGLSETIPICSYNHAEKMLELMKNAPSVVKGKNKVGVKYDFTKDAIGELPKGATDNGVAKTTFLTATDPKDPDNKVLEIKKDTEGNDGGGQLTVPLFTAPKMTDDTVVEFGMRINVSSDTRYGNSISGSNPNIMQMRFMSESDPFWMPTLRFNDGSDPTGYVFLVEQSTSGGKKEYPDNQQKTFEFDTWYQFTFRLTIKNYGKSGASFKVEILVDGEPFGTSTNFYSDSIAFRESALMRIRFAPQMRIHADIFVDDITASVLKVSE